MNPEGDINRVTLSGLLNFVDGLWSCCGDERIFVFTTNHVEKLDKALLRPGRMDMQIELSYCTFLAFKVLAQNYLSIQDHPLFAKVESAFAEKTMTPAQIAELLIKDKNNVDVALESVISALENSVPEPPAQVTGTNPDAIDSKDENDEDSLKNLAVGGDNSSEVETRRSVISTVLGAIAEREKDADSSPTGSSTPQSVTGKTQVVQPEILLTTSEVKRHESEASSSTMKDLVQSIRATLVKSKGDIDSAIEGIIHVLENKLPISEIQHNISVDESANGSANGHCATECSSPPELANGTSSLKAALNRVYRETQNGAVQ